MDQHLQHALVDVFDRLPLERQPHAIICVGSDQDFPREEIYRLIVERTLRGLNLEKLPLQMVGAMTGQQELAEVAVSWVEIPILILTQVPAEAESFLIAAAGASLFNGNPLLRYPRVADICAATLHCLQDRQYRVRRALGSDLDRLCELEKLCWQHTRASRQRIRERIQKYPDGQFVLEKDGRLLGVVYSQRIEDPCVLDDCNASIVHKLHRDSGRIIQLLAINIDPSVQNLGYGDQLLEFMLQRCSLVMGVDRVVGVTLCKNYDAKCDEPFGRYIHREGTRQDPVLAFHQAHGAKVTKTLADYRPQDLANCGYGVLIEYDILNRYPRKIDASAAERASAAPPPGRSHIQTLVETAVAQLLGANGDVLDPDQPLMEMGLDSADLLQLLCRIEEAYRRRLQPGFFFEHNTIAKVVEYFAVEPSTIADVASQPNSSTKTQLESSADIAVVGMACKLPGNIETPEELWSTLALGNCVIGTYPQSRGAWPDKPGIARGGFLEQAEAFDAAFFRISPTEAKNTDPQQRILLQLAWSCLEDACVLPSVLKGSNTGVFIGASNCDYSRLTQACEMETEAHHATGSSLAVLANRLSYFFDLCGPSLLIDTACSASLVALHTALQSLRAGECEAALVGGINLICHPDLSTAYHKAGMLSPDGRCKSFDARADGYVRSEGAVVLLLKPLANALAQGDRVHAVIKGSAINHGGLAGGLTVPNPRKQSDLLMAAWKNAGVAPHKLSYIEAHGTGTSLGDPIEIQGIQTAYERQRGVQEDMRCAIGSVKSNLGHLEAAAGLAGLQKVILALQHREIPASIHFEQLNPKINLSESPFYIADKHEYWDAPQPRTAGVSSFGSGGANAHVVVAEWTSEATTDTEEEKPRLFVLSARNKERLKKYAEIIALWVERCSEGISFADFIYTFQVGRSPMEERLTVAASGFIELKTRLNDWLHAGKVDDQVRQGSAKRASEKTEATSSDSEGRILASPLAEIDLSQLALFWTSGLDVDFSSLYTKFPQKISAPSYPFDNKRYWIELPINKAVHPLLGSRTVLGEGVVFSKTWGHLPGHLLFTQEDFSCLSLGLVLEALTAASNTLFPMLKVAAIEKFRYYPFHIEVGDQISYETRSYSRGSRAHTELVQILGEEQILIADAELLYIATADAGIAVPPRAGANWFETEESAEGSWQLPVETLKSVFPALLKGSTSQALSIPRIAFHGSGIWQAGPMLVALTPHGVSVLTGAKEPVLSILN